MAITPHLVPFDKTSQPGIIIANINYVNELP